MTDAIDSAQLAMNIDKIQLEAVSHNVANLHSPGYRKQFVITPVFDTMLHPNHIDIQAQTAKRYLQRQGTLDKTGRLLDIALHGDGYFTIETAHGLRYTRRGDFHLNRQGELVTFDGNRVLLEGGSVSLDDDAVHITSDGIIYQKNKPVAKLRLTKFLPETRFDATGHGYFAASDSGDKPDASCQVRQGFLEQSNVKTVDEMMDLVRISRHFQTSQRLMRLSDDLLGKAISQLGEG